jgi:hypothetical protein
MRGVDEWKTILDGYSCDESDDDDDGENVVSIQRRARRVMELCAPLVPTDAVPDDMREAHAKCVAVRGSSSATARPTDDADDEKDADRWTRLVDPAHVCKKNTPPT